MKVVELLAHEPLLSADLGDLEYDLGDLPGSTVTLLGCFPQRVVPDLEGVGTDGAS
jgi:hypothetical protein